MRTNFLFELANEKIQSIGFDYDDKRIKFISINILSHNFDSEI